jgi:glutamyl-tRNA reductase
LATRLHGHAVHFDSLASVLASADIVLSSTAAPHHVLTRETFRKAFPTGVRRPLFIIDIAIPRDVDPALGDESDVFLYNVDDLWKIVDETVRVREEALPQAEAIILERSLEFRSWYASLEVVPVIRRIREHAELHRKAELDRLLQSLGDLDPGALARVEEFSRRLLNKVLHDPTVQLRRGLEREGRDDLVDAVRFLYGLEGRELPPLDTEPDPESGDPDHSISERRRNDG